MRPIKFRAWDEVSGGMVMFTLHELMYWYKQHGVECPGEGKRADLSAYFFKLKTVASPFLMQFTGLLDKNGKEIYESDIVSWSDGDYKSRSNPRIAEVRLYPSLHFFAVNVGSGHAFHYGNFIYADTENHLEVIGNIYENPELLT